MLDLWKKPIEIILSETYCSSSDTISRVIFMVVMLRYLINTDLYLIVTTKLEHQMLHNLCTI